MQIEGSTCARATLGVALGTLLTLVFTVSAAENRQQGHSMVLPSGATASRPDGVGAIRQMRLPGSALPIRSIDGRGNNEDRPGWGSAGSTLLRRSTIDYADGINAPAAPARAGAREISNLCSAQEDLIPSSVSSFFWQWGQFVDHDIDLVPVMDPRESLEIPVPAGDRFFDPERSGSAVIRFERSLYRKENGVRQQVNDITAFIDASNVYGSDPERASALRAMDGTGRLATSRGRLLPFNTSGMPNAPTKDDPSLFLAGDFRANEQVGLIAMHTVFVREHNWWAERYGAENPGLRGDEIYELARTMVAAEMQAITYREFLPRLLGPSGMPPYRGYDPDVNPGISNVFATAAYRFGHSMLPSRLLRLDADGNEVAAGHLSLTDSFFNPALIRDGGIESVLRGLAAQPSQRVDTFVVSAVRNFLFGGPRAGGFDLAALNVQRGRDHGLPSYNQVRVDFGMTPRSSFAEINRNTTVQFRLSEAYRGVDDIDAWVGGLSEPPARGALVGETVAAVLRDQFVRLRSGDRFWYQSALPPEMVVVVEQQTLARIIRRNTSIGDEISDDIFRLPRRRRP